MGVGRNMLYADYHIAFRQCIDGQDAYLDNSQTGWSCGGTFVPGMQDTRGNEFGISWTWGDGTEVYWAWSPVLSDG